MTRAALLLLLLPTLAGSDGPRVDVETLPSPVAGQTVAELQPGTFFHTSDILYLRVEPIDYVSQHTLGHDRHVLYGIADQPMPVPGAVYAVNVETGRLMLMESGTWAYPVIDARITVRTR